MYNKPCEVIKHINDQFSVAIWAIAVPTCGFRRTWWRSQPRVVLGLHRRALCGVSGQHADSSFSGEVGTAKKSGSGAGVHQGQPRVVGDSGAEWGRPSGWGGSRVVAVSQAA